MTEEMTTKSRRYDMLGLAVVLLAALALAAPLGAHAHGNHPKAVKRTGQCSKPSQQTKRIAKHTAGYAKKRFALDGLVTNDERTRANKQMNHFLRWKLGGAAAVCGQYVTANYDHFERAYSDEAAAMMLGILQFSRQEPELELPPWMIAYLKFKYDMVTVGGTAAVLERLGLPDHYINSVRRKIFDQVTKPVFDAVVSVSAYVPKGFDIDNRFVQEAIAGRRYANQGLDTLRRDWDSGKSGRQGPDLGRTIPDTGSGLPGSKGPVTGGKTPPDKGSGSGGSAGTCPGNQIRLDDGSCGCLPDEVLQGDTCVVAGGSPPEHADEPGYQEPPPPPPEAESPVYTSDEMPLEGDIPWYEK